MSHWCHPTQRTEGISGTLFLTLRHTPSVKSPPRTEVQGKKTFNPSDWFLSAGKRTRTNGRRQDFLCRRTDRIRKPGVYWTGDCPLETDCCDTRLCRCCASWTRASAPLWLRKGVFVFSGRVRDTSHIWSRSNLRVLLRILGCDRVLPEGAGLGGPPLPLRPLPILASLWLLPTAPVPLGP